MNQDMILEFIVDMKKSLDSILNKKQGIRGVKLDELSKMKFKSLEEFLPALKLMKERITEELLNIAPESEKLKNEHEKLYTLINEVIRRLDEDEQKLSDFEKNLSLKNEDKEKYLDEKVLLEEKRRVFEKEFNDKKSELNQAWIPLYGLIIIKKLQRIEREDIPYLESQIRSCESEIQRNEEHLFNINKEIVQLSYEIQGIKEVINKEKEVYQSSARMIDDIKQKISNKVKDLSYLSILENKIMDSITKGIVTSDIMKMLDMEPEIIHYDDETVYFDLMTIWQQTKKQDVLEEFFMQTEKKFFSQL